MSQVSQRVVLHVYVAWLVVLATGNLQVGVAGIDGHLLEAVTERQTVERVVVLAHEDGSGPMLFVVVNHYLAAVTACDGLDVGSRAECAVATGGILQISEYGISFVGMVGVPDGE